MSINNKYEEKRTEASGLVFLLVAKSLYQIERLFTD